MAHPRHKRETNARRTNRAAVIVGPLAVLATASAVTLGVLSADPAVSENVATARPASDVLVEARTSIPVTRSDSRKQPAERPTAAKPSLMSKQAVRTAIKRADTHRWTTADLNLWTEPAEAAKQVGEIGSGEKVLVTGRSAKGRVEIVVNGKARWVTEGYLSDEKPPTLGGECTNGTSVPSGVSPNIVAVHRAVCAAFPEISVYGTLRGGGGDHPLGRAVDIMVSGARGWEVAEFVRENYDALGVTYVIYSQRIWSVQRGGEGWRGMENRGSVTANHYDHVHVSTY